MSNKFLSIFDSEVKVFFLLLLLSSFNVFAFLVGIHTEKHAQSMILGRWKFNFEMGNKYVYDFFINMGK